MLNLTASRITRSDEAPIDPTSILSAAGCALVQGNLPGTVKPSTGSAGEKFVGASMSQPLTLISMPKVEKLVVGADAKVALLRAPIGGTLRIVNPTNVALAAGAPAADNTKYSITGQDVTVHADFIGKTITVCYQYSPTVIEARIIQGDVQPGGAASLTTGTVPVARAGTVVTSEYDTTVDWTAINPDVKTGANGRFTIGGTGCLVPSSQITQVPSSSDGLLGLYFSA